MKWEEYQNSIPAYEYFSDREKTDIECPNCGAPVWRRTDIILTSYPPKLQYECDYCGWVGYGQ